MNNTFYIMIRICAITGISAVILGAFGAHVLKEKLSSDLLESYKTGVLYHFIHVLAMALCVVLYKIENSIWIKRSFYFFLSGIVLFSGSIYLLSTREVTMWDVKILGPVTPIGGLLYIIGWLSLAFIRPGSRLNSL